MERGSRPVFETGGAEPSPPGTFVVRASDGREAAWMAAGAAAVLGSSGVVVAHTQIDRAEARRIASQATVPILIAHDFEEASSMFDGTPPLGAMCMPQDGNELDSILRELCALTPPNGWIVTEEAVPHTDGGRVLAGLVPGSRGHGLAAAIGAKAASPERPVMAALSEESFVLGSPALAVAVRYSLPVGAVVRASGTECRADLIAEGFGGHGELLVEPGALRLHLHNALATGVPSVISVGMRRRRLAEPA